MSARDDIKDIFLAALNEANPCRILKEKLSFHNGCLFFDSTRLIDLGGINRIFVVGAGKATAPMAKAIEDTLNGLITRGIIIVKYGHGKNLTYCTQIEAAHPIPDRAGLKGTETILRMLEGMDGNTLVMVLLSGGASALLVSPVDAISLEEKMEVTSLLLRAGASIGEVNAVRKHISRIKGGRLARYVQPAYLISFVLSDVIGDRLDVIASGPTVPDRSTFHDAMKVIEKYQLKDEIPVRVLDYINKGIRGEVEETPKGDEDFFKKSQTLIIGNINNAINGARRKAHEKGYKTEIISSSLQGEARNVANMLAERALEYRRKGYRKLCLIAGGETTVTVKGKGQGGRNQEMALAFAIKIKGENNILMLSAGTDGTDGPTDAAGAIVDGNVVSIALTNGLDPERYLEENDSYSFFKKLDDITGNGYHLKTGPTDTNVMDLQVILID